MSPDCVIACVSWLLKVCPFVTKHSLVTNIKIILVAARSVFLDCCTLVFPPPFYYLTDHILSVDLFYSTRNHIDSADLIYPRRIRICRSRNVLRTLQLQPSYYIATGTPSLTFLFCPSDWITLRFKAMHALLFSCQRESDENL